ncbi:MAG: hypothetical protein QGF49_08080, partial [Candidatus Marinimicrobia bacterium]|nr:hypothetical protein [Candidatus Neomarinimicrobiota bacterium]
KWREETYKDGKKDGLWTWWHMDGYKSIEGTYKDEEMDKLWTTWYDKKQKKAEGNYKNKKLTEKKCWDEEGNDCECGQQWQEGCK